MEEEEEDVYTCMDVKQFMRDLIKISRGSRVERQSIQL